MKTIKLKSYGSSGCLTAAVEEEVLSATEANIVFAIVVNTKRPWYVGRELRMPTVEVKRTYKRAIRKLKQWLKSDDVEVCLVMESYGMLEWIPE